jgi:endoglucanase
MDKVSSTYISKGIGVIIGEYGVAASNKELDSVRKYIYTVAKACYDRDILPILWDTPGGYYDRNSCSMVDPILKDMLRSIKT